MLMEGTIISFGGLLYRIEEVLPFDTDGSYYSLRDVKTNKIIYLVL